jgi:integrase
MSSLFKQHGKYHLQFYDSNRQPKQKRVSLGVTRKKDAKKLERRLVSAYAENLYDPWTDDFRNFRRKDRDRLDIRNALSRFLDSKKEQGRKARTIRNYRQSIERLIGCIGNRQLENLTAAMLNEWIRAAEVSESTRHTRYRYAHAFLNWCVQNGSLTENPLKREPTPKRSERLPKTMYAEDLEAICDEIRRDYRTKRKKGLCDDGEVIWRERAFRFAFYTGLRGSELSRLQWKHIDRRRGLIYILEQKNGKEETIPLHGKAAAVLDDLKEGAADSCVFGGPGTHSGTRNIEAFRNNLSRAFRRYKKAAGIERPISLHSLRHGFCTALAEAGKSAATIKELARHASIETSMIYVKMSNEHLKKEMEDVF